MAKADGDGDHALIAKPERPVQVYLILNLAVSVPRTPPRLNPGPHFVLMLAVVFPVKVDVEPLAIP